MRVILQEKVPNLGNIGDIVLVKPGYARNFLLPLAKALRATDENVAALASRRIELQQRAEALLEQAKVRLAKLSELTFIIESQASEEGRLFGSVGPREIAETAVQMGVDLLKSEVRLPQGPIRSVGDYEVDLFLTADIHGKLKVTVKAVA